MTCRIFLGLSILFTLPGKSRDSMFIPSGWAERQGDEIGHPLGIGALSDSLPKHAIARLGTLCLRQTEYTDSVAYSPDGKTLASRTVRGTIHLWDTNTGELFWVHHFLEDGGAMGGQVIFSPDGRQLATVGHEGVHLWDLTNKRSKLLSKVGLPIAFSPDSKLAVGATDRDLVIFDLKSFSVKFRLVQRARQIFAAAFSPNGKIVATWEGPIFDKASPSIIRLWDSCTGKQTGELIGQQGFIRSLSFSPDGNILVSADEGARPCLWDTAKRKEIARVDHFAACVAVFSPNGKLLATGDDTRLRLWDTATWKEVRSIRTLRTPNWQRSMAFSPDGKKLLTCGMSNALQLWNVETGQEALPSAGHRYMVASIQFSPDGKILASQDANGTVCLWDLTGKKESRRLCSTTEDEIPPKTGYVSPGVSIVFSPDGRTLIATSGRSKQKREVSVHLWDIVSERICRELHAPRLSLSVRALSPDGQILAARDGTGIQFWSITSGTQLQTLTDDLRRGLGCAAFAPNGRLLAASGISIKEGVSGRLLLLDWANGRIIRDFQSPRHGATYLTLSTNGCFLASCYQGVGNKTDNTIQLHEPATGSLIRTLEGKNSTASCVAFCPDGRLLASACPTDQSVRIWDVFTGKELARFIGHRGPVYCVAFSPDGKTVASGSADTTILLWDVSKIQPEQLPSVARNELPKEVARLWEQMQSKDGAKAYQAMWRLIGAGDDAVAFLDRKLHPVPPSDAKLLSQAILDLNSEDFDKREKGTAHLSKLGELAEPALRQALQSKPSLEVRKRIEHLLADFAERPFRELELYQVRALHALELIGSPAALDLLKKLAAGAAGARLTRDAKLALKRLERRAIKP